MNARSPMAPMAADVPMASGSPMGTSRAAYLATGGLENRFVQAKVRYDQSKRERATNRAYAQLISEGRAGMQKIYDDAVATYGEEIKGWMPMVEVFRDPKSGAYDAVKYSSHALTAILKFEEMRDKKGKADKEQAAADKSAAGMGALQGLELPPNASREQVYRAIAGSPDAMNAPENAIKTMTSGYQSEQERAQTQKMRQGPTGGGGSGSISNDPLVKLKAELRQHYTDEVKFDQQIADLTKKIGTARAAGALADVDEISDMQVQLKEIKDKKVEYRKVINATKKAIEIATERGASPYAGAVRAGAEAVRAEENKQVGEVMGALSAEGGKTLSPTMLLDKASTRGMFGTETADKAVGRLSSGQGAPASGAGGAGGQVDDETIIAKLVSLGATREEAQKYIQDPGSRMAIEQAIRDEFANQ